MKRIGELWCNLMHESSMWPIHGRYQCSTCGREYRVAWQDTNSQSDYTSCILELPAASN
jgi:hypothetical protein